MTEAMIQGICNACGGSGIDNRGIPPGACGSCGGDGWFSKGEKIDITDIVGPANVFQSYIILECLDATEHGALTDTQKDGILHLLACGLVDLNDGKAGKTRLWNWFGAESTTVANMTALLE